MDTDVMDVNVETQTKTPEPPRQAPPRRTFMRSLISEIRRLYYRLTKESIAGFLWTLAWTIPITVFIWIYAQSQLQDSDPNQPLRIQVQSRDPSEIVTLDPNESVITCDLAGPRANLDRFKQQMLNPDTAPITIAVDPRHIEGGIPTLESLTDNAIFRDAGVTISNCKPPVLAVNVDTVARATLPVRPPPGVAVLNASFDPPTVNVSGPSRTISHLTEVNPDLSAIPDMDKPGPKSGTVRLNVDADVTVSPQQVKATLTIPEANVQWPLTNVRILIAEPQDTRDRYDIQLNSKFAPPIQVSGPPEEKDAYERGGVQPVALLEIGPDNVTTPGPTQLNIQGLPADVKVVGTPPSVGFTATPK